jgi:ABC-type uncharacterized transport system involved in gliding motility auxiliary subunit
MEAEFEQLRGEKLEDLKGKEAEAQSKIDALQAQKTAGAQASWSPEQLKELRLYREQQAKINKEMRNEQKSLKKDKDKLATTITVLNIFVIPLVIFFIAIIVQARRRAARGAR